MKIRYDFVTNSSSSSFVISKNHLTDEQISKIRNHISVAKEITDSECDFSYCDEGDMWSISENAEQICGFTIMDNFDFYSFLVAIGVRSDVIEWED